MSEMGGLVEFGLVAIFALGWALLERQGRAERSEGEDGQA